MLGSKVMTEARIATARRQIADNATQSRCVNPCSGDPVNRGLAAENMIKRPLEKWVLGRSASIREDRGMS
jgi:hypothetical protein